MKEGVTCGIVTKDRPLFLNRLLTVIAEMQPRCPLEVIVYDNSESCSAREVATRFRSIRYLHGGGSLPHGRNEILERTDSSILAFLDDDALPTNREYFDMVCEDFSSMRGTVACVGGPVIDVWPDLRPVLPLHGGKGFNRFRPRDQTLWQQMHSSCWIPDSRCEVDFVNGGNMSFDTDLLTSIGGFDEAFGRGSGKTSLREETDAHLTLRARGYRILYDPRLRVDHLTANYGGGRDRSILGRYLTRYYYGRNDLYLLKKHQLLSLNSYTAWWKSVLLTYFRRDGLGHQAGLARDEIADGEADWVGARVLRPAVTALSLLLGQLAEAVRPSTPVTPKGKKPWREDQPR